MVALCITFSAFFLYIKKQIILLVSQKRLFHLDIAFELNDQTVAK